MKEKTSKPNISQEYLESQGYTTGRPLVLVTVGEGYINIEDDKDCVLHYKLPKEKVREHEQVGVDEFAINFESDYLERTFMYTSSLEENYLPEHYWENSVLFDPISNSHYGFIVAHEGNLDAAIAYTKRIYTYKVEKLMAFYRDRADKLEASIKEVNTVNAKRLPPDAHKIHAEFWQREFGDGLYRMSLYSVDEDYNGDYNPESPTKMERLTFRVDHRTSVGDDWKTLDGSKQKTYVMTRIADCLASNCVAYLISKIHPALESGDYKDVCRKLADFKTSEVPSFY